MQSSIPLFTAAEAIVLLAAGCGTTTSCTTDVGRSELVVIVRYMSIQTNTVLYKSNSLKHPLTYRIGGIFCGVKFLRISQK